MSYQVLENMNSQETVATATVKVCCPYCKGGILVENDPGISVVYCAQCATEFRVTDGMQVLDWIEYLTRRMVVGLLEFVYCRVPAWLYACVVAVLNRAISFFSWLVPFSVKVVRVTGWVGLWLFILLGPAAVFVISAVHTGLTFASAAAAVFWVIAVSTGYIWAYLHYPGRQKEAFGWKQKCGVSLRMAASRIMSLAWRK